MNNGNNIQKKGQVKKTTERKNDLIKVIEK